MAAVGGSQHLLVRRVPAPGEIGCVGACPLCTVPGSAARHPPCLACREELRARLAEMQLSFYVARALN
ncbi:MAG TPA: hypothetical protein VFH78_16110 [Candidatus Thermoplasmatota archaeon]|nr:hypothetical protein [Candidatus Thermoplasmatota archaeon]